MSSAVEQSSRPDRHPQAAGPPAVPSHAPHVAVPQNTSPATEPQNPVCVLCNQPHKKCNICKQDKMIDSYKLSKRSKNLLKSCRYCREEFEKVRQRSEAMDPDEIHPQSPLRCTKCELLKRTPEFRIGKEKTLFKQCQDCRGKTRTYRSTRFERDNKPGFRRCVGCNTLCPDTKYVVKLDSNKLGTVCGICRKRAYEKRHNTSCPDLHRMCTRCLKVKHVKDFDGDWLPDEPVTCRVCCEKKIPSDTRRRAKKKMRQVKEFCQQFDCTRAPKPVEPTLPPSINDAEQEYFTCKRCSQRIKIKNRDSDHDVCTYCGFEYFFSDKVNKDGTQGVAVSTRASDSSLSEPTPAPKESPTHAPTPVDSPFSKRTPGTSSSDESEGSSSTDSLFEDYDPEADDIPSLRMKGAANARSDKRPSIEANLDVEVNTRDTLDFGEFRRRIVDKGNRKLLGRVLTTAKRRREVLMRGRR
ncbi:hypothetical protein IWZ01DRAFT_539563 [Phyllosticta capitalensis]